MLEDKIQSFMEETLRENTSKTQAKMLLIFNLHKSDKSMCLGEYMNRSLIIEWFYGWLKEKCMVGMH